MTIIYNARIVDQNTNKKGAVIIKGTKIARVLFGAFKSCESVLAAANFGFAKSSGVAAIDARGLVLSPAFIDMHAHFRYPGQTQKEDLDSALNAAAAGGFGRG